MVGAAVMEDETKALVIFIDEWVTSNSQIYRNILKV